MRPLQSLTFAILLTLFFSSCATITRGSTDSVIVRTQPSGALVSLSNGMTGTSPASFEVPRKHTLVVSICKPGYQPMEVTLNPVISGEGGTHFAGNLLAGGIIGAAVDSGSGAMYDLTPNPLEVTLVPIDGYEGDLYDESMREYQDEYAQAIREDRLHEFGMDDPRGYDMDDMDDMDDIDPYDMDGMDDIDTYDMEEDPYNGPGPLDYDSRDMSDIPVDGPGEYVDLPVAPIEPTDNGTVDPVIDVPGPAPLPEVPAPGETQPGQNPNPVTPAPAETTSSNSAKTTPAAKEKGILKFE